MNKSDLKRHGLGVKGCPRPPKSALSNHRSRGWKTVLRTISEIARILRVVFFFWQLVSIALVATAIASLLRSADRRHRREKAKGAPAVESDFNSFDRQFAGPDQPFEF
jgi:hypothetical protein